MRDALVVSAMVQLVVVVLLGWVTAAMVGGAESVGPFKVQRRVLQAHLFWLLHVIFALVISVADVELATASVWLYIVGSWTAPLGSVYQATRPGFDVKISPVYKALTSIPIVVLSVALTWIAVATIAERL